MTLDEFIIAYKITVTAERIPIRTDTDISAWGKKAHHWAVTLHRPVSVANPAAGEHVMAVPYSTGSALIERVPFNEVKPSVRFGCSRAEWEKIPRPGTGSLTVDQVKYQPHAWRPTVPTAADILECVIGDAISIRDSVNFEDWANEMGMNPDSRADERAYEAVKREARLLTQFLGSLTAAAFELEMP